MSEDKIRSKALTLVIILLAVALYNNYRMKQELNNLRSEMSSMEAVLRNEINGVRNDADRKYESVTKMMEQEASLFSDTSIRLGMQDGKLVVTMRAVPKALEKNETVTASLTADGTVYRQALDAENQAQFMLEPAEWLEPAFVIESDTGYRQEILKPVYAVNTMLTRVECDFYDYEANDEGRFHFWITGNTDGNPFEEDEITMAEAKIAANGMVENPGGNGGSHQGSGHSQAVTEAQAVEVQPAAYDQLAGEDLTLTKLSGEADKIVGYRIDVSDYIGRKDNVNYEVYLRITLKNGLQYVTGGPLVSFASTENSSSRSGGSENLAPVLDF